jgi:ubiquinone biosynthesis monooxygenase Coq7
MDYLLISIDNALKTLLTKPIAIRRVHENSAPISNKSSSETDPLHPQLSKDEQSLSGALMRVNHVGEICAQALYASQSLATQNKSLKTYFKDASIDEFDHLAWTGERIEELGTHKSYLNPLWYAGAFGIGYLVAKIGGEQISLGFVAETERQVSEHLGSHLQKLPPSDFASKDIVKQMKLDEEAHAKKAVSIGAKELPPPVKQLMRAAAKLMTTTAHYI